MKIKHVFEKRKMKTRAKRKGGKDEARDRSHWLRNTRAS